MCVGPCRVDWLCQTSFLPANIEFRQHDHSSMVGLIYIPFSGVELHYHMALRRVSSRYSASYLFSIAFALTAERVYMLCLYDYMYAYLNNRLVTC